MGISPPPILQQRMMLPELRTSLWNILYRFYHDHLITPYYRQMDFIFEMYWEEFLKLPNSQKPIDITQIVPLIETIHTKESFDACLQWNQIYDFWDFTIDLLIKGCNMEKQARELMDEFNRISERENSAYRFVGSYIVEIISDEEIKEIDHALCYNNSATKHINTSLKLLSNRVSPDYRNSIKESISAVESMAKVITGKPKATLADILKKEYLALHPALKDGLTKIYGWSGDADGIRHALVDETTVSLNEARLMLVLCSAFVNYLRNKFDVDLVNNKVIDV